MHLSDQQNEVVMSGNRRAATWTPIDLPTQVTDLPEWLLDAHVDLMIAYANAPSVKLKTSRDPWPLNEPVLYEDEGGGAWTARSSDGYVMRRYYHTGQIRKHIAWRVMYGVDPKTIVTKAHKDGWQIPIDKYGETGQQSAEREAAAHLELCKRVLTKNDDPSLYSIEYKEVFATSRQEGFGGSHFPLRLKNGTDLVLRGPWHGGAPVGWTDLVIVDMSYEWNKNPPVTRGRTRTWYENGGSGGFFFSEELALKAVARYAPHLGAAMVYPGYGHARVEFYDLNWGAPKRFAEKRLPGWGSL